MRLFSNKLNQLNEIINTQPENRVKKFGEFRANLNKGVGHVIESTGSKVVAKVDYSEVERLFGRHKFSFMEPHIGPHPDFQHIGPDDYLHHYAVSMFADIKGSTQLAKKYDLYQIRQIKDTILTLVIEACSFFGGHIHRLQGDGVFVYFVRSEMNEKDAMINALNAASLISFFMKYQLPEHFSNEDIDPPKIRIGIDYGNAEQTLWSYYGLNYCTELTTTSLHTDLAAKLQAKAGANQIMIGQNVVQELDLEGVVAEYNRDDPFIFNQSYKRYEFFWSKYLLRYDFISKDCSGALELTEPDFRLECEIAEKEEGPFYFYHQNLYSIPKGYKIKFTLVHRGVPYHRREHTGEEIHWDIINTGKEARAKDKLNEQIDKAKNEVQCIVDAEYLGLHQMRCKIKRNRHSINRNIYFSVFVR
jgi:class 3 adenylate cyclase